MRLSPAHRPDAFKSAAQGIVSALAKAREGAELDKIFVGAPAREGPATSSSVNAPVDRKVAITYLRTVGTADRQRLRPRR